VPVSEVEEYSDRWAPYGIDLMKGGLSWASTLHTGLRGGGAGPLACTLSWPATTGGVELYNSQTPLMEWS